jgi:hypothetical protein
MYKNSGLDFTDGGKAEDRRFAGQKIKDSKPNTQFQNALYFREKHIDSFEQYQSLTHH